MSPIRVQVSGGPSTSGISRASAIARVDAIRQLRDGGEAIRGLPRREREVLALLALSELSYGEIGEALGLPVGTVRSRLARARSRLGGAFPDPTGAARPEEEFP